MPVTVKCGKCGKLMRAPDELAGKRVKCPGCGSPVPVPSAAPAANLLDGLGEDDPFSSSGSNLDNLSQAAGKSVAGANPLSAGADPLGPAPTPEAPPKKDLRPVLIVGGSIAAAVVLVILIVVVAMFMFQGDSQPVAALPAGANPAPGQTAPRAAKAAPPEPVSAAEGAPAKPAEDMSALFDAPQAPAASSSVPPANPAVPAPAAAASPAAAVPPAPAAQAPPAQPSPPTVVASAPPINPVPAAPVAVVAPPVPVAAPAPVAMAPVPAPVPVPNFAPGPVAPLDPQQKAQNEKAAREQVKELRQSYRDLLTGDPQALVEQMRWSPAGKRPTLGLRVGINLPVPQPSKANRPQPPAAADSEPAIVQAMGPPGTKLLTSLNERIARGDFCPVNSNGSDARQRVTVLPGEDKGEVFVAARERDVDVVLLVKLELQAGHHRKKKGGGPPGGDPSHMSRTLTATVVDVARISPGWISDSLSDKNKPLTEKDATDWANQCLEQLDEFKLQSVPELDEQQVEKRMIELEKKKLANPLAALTEVRYYQLKKLVPVERATAFFTQVLGEKGKLLTSDDAKERKQALEKVAKL